MIFFWIKEAFKSIGRAKSSFVLTLISLTLAVILIEASLAAIQLSDVFQKRLKNNISLHIFLKDYVSYPDIKKAEKLLKNQDFILSVRYISKKQAARDFIKETGEDFRDILDYNPLPASFVVKLNTNVVKKDSLQSTINRLSKYKWVDEVIFRDRFLYRFLGYVNTGKNYLFIITGVLMLIAVYLVYSTIKLIIQARMQELETMKLVGAKLITIKMPIILNGLLTGIIASIFGIIIYYFVAKQLSEYSSLNHFIERYKFYYLITLALIGPVLSFIVTLFSLRKLSLKI